MVGQIKEKPERMWSTDRDQQLKMQRLYVACLEAKGMPLEQAQTYIYAATIMINSSGNVLPSYRAQLVFEAAAAE